MKLLLVSILVISLAQVFPSCGQDQSGNEVVGWVEAKKLDPTDRTFVLVINGHDYDVPSPFWQTVRVGDLVKWDGITWTIVRKGG